MKIKVCGMKYPENIREVARLQPDYLGFIFYENSPRNFTGDIPDLPAGIKKTGVFVNSPVDTVRDKVKKHGLDVVQLHGEESPEDCLAVSQSGVEVWKVFSVGENFDIASLAPYENKVSGFLLDTKGEQRGGTGKKFNWQLLENYSSSTPFVLSGGIGPEDLAEVLSLNKTNLPMIAVDVNSRFEEKPGLKNPDLLRPFIKKIKA